VVFNHVINKYHLICEVFGINLESTNLWNLRLQACNSEFSHIWKPEMVEEERNDSKVEGAEM